MHRSRWLGFCGNRICISPRGRIFGTNVFISITLIEQMTKFMVQL